MVSSVAHDVARPVHSVAHTQEPLTDCLRKFRETQHDCLPVTADKTSTQVIGIVTQTDLLELYRPGSPAQRIYRDAAGPDGTGRRHASHAVPIYGAGPAVPATLIDKTIRELDLRVRYGITVLALRNRTSSGYEDRLPQPDLPLQEDEILILAGPRRGYGTAPAGDSGVPLIFD